MIASLISVNSNKYLIIKGANNMCGDKGDCKKPFEKQCDKCREDNSSGKSKKDQNSNESDPAPEKEDNTPKTGGCCNK